MCQVTDSQYACALVVSEDVFDTATSDSVFSGPNPGRLDVLLLAIW